MNLCTMPYDTIANGNHYKRLCKSPPPKIVQERQRSRNKEMCSLCGKLLVHYSYARDYGAAVVESRDLEGWRNKEPRV